jgi:hypothetical protein
MKGHVRERGKGNWYAVIDVRDGVTGKRKRKWHSLPNCKGKRDAQNECATIVAKLASGEYVEPSKTTLAEFMERWLDQIKTQVAPRSFERYAEIARKNVIPALGQLLLKRLHPENISTAYNQALTSGRRDGNGGLSPRTVNHMHRVLKQALKQACAWGELQRNPADLVRPPKVERKTMHTYDLPQTVALLEAMRPTRMFVPTVLGGSAGCAEVRLPLYAGQTSILTPPASPSSRVQSRPIKASASRKPNQAGPETSPCLKPWWTN